MEVLVEVNESSSSYETTTTSATEDKDDIERGVEHLMLVDGNIDRLDKSLNERGAHCALSSSDPMQRIHR